MHWLDWTIVLLFFIYTIWDGTRSRENRTSTEGLLLAGRNMPWWAAGLSVMATQASAITFIGTTGQAFMHDMRFLQVYLGLPIAMVVLSITLVPLYRRWRVFTAYEVLERRFGLRVRLATSLLFLISRGIAMGVTIAAPAYVLALLLNVPLLQAILAIGLVATFYTMFGGIAGVIRTDIKQMTLMLGGLVFCFGWIIYHLPPEVDFGAALQLAGAAGKLQTIDLEFNLTEPYNIWSGVLAGFFLMLSYFGADQSQVQRYLTVRSLGEARASLLLSAIFKVPMQFFILLLGVLLWVFFLFAERPLLFLPDTLNEEDQSAVADNSEEDLLTQRALLARDWLADPGDLSKREDWLTRERELEQVRKTEMARLEAIAGDRRDDTNYVFPYFLQHYIPAGLLGLLIAAILAAALSSIDSILNSLAACSIMDWYARLHSSPPSPKKTLWATRLATLIWGVLATAAAVAFGETQSIIELVNQIGSYFYGPILGVFILLAFPKVKGNTVLGSLFFGLAGVILIGSIVIEAGSDSSYILAMPLSPLPANSYPLIEYLWLNPIGDLLVVFPAWLFTSCQKNRLQARN